MSIAKKQQNYKGKGINSTNHLVYSRVPALASGKLSCQVYLYMPASHLASQSVACLLIDLDIH